MAKLDTEPSAADPKSGGTERRVALFGNPNVGKSVLFNNLTGAYVVVSNYPGTSVEVCRGRGKIGGEQWEVIDTPGLYSLLPLSEDESIARRILTEEKPDVLVHVADARNLDRMLILTFQLIESGRPVILALNMMDEARARGLSVDTDELSAELGIPVIETVSVTGEGMDDLRREIERSVGGDPGKSFRYQPAVEEYIEKIASMLMKDYPATKRLIALLLLQKDEEIADMVSRAEGEGFAEIKSTVEEAGKQFSRPLDYLLTVQRGQWATALAGRVMHHAGEPKPTFAEKLSRWLVHPITGLPILLLVLYLGLYKFVGEFGAGTVVDFIEEVIFEGRLNPFIINLFESIIPWTVLSDLFVGEYGALTLGLRYAVGIILPVITFFFLVFAIIEDSGYLPRLALLLDRLFKKIGLSGRAVIPMVLGLGCDTMATVVTRTLASKRERVISVLLLSVAVPCSAQLGLILALLSDTPAALITWAVVILGVYLAVGAAAARVMPGKATPFYVEVPPLRLPRIKNVLGKTFARVRWYFREVLPLFLLASLLIWLGQLTGLFDLAIRVLEHPVSWIGLPSEASEVFLFGFFRRDYGAAGLFDLARAGMLNGTQIVVAAVALTLFMPCVAHFLVTIRERGWKTTAWIAASVLIISFGVAAILNYMFAAFSITF